MRKVYLLTFLIIFLGNISVKVRKYCGYLYLKCFAVITHFLKLFLINSHYAKHEQQHANAMRRTF